jgi:hypothetical protein
MLMKLILVALAACGAATILIIHEAPNPTPAPPAPPAPAVLRPATAKELRTLNSLKTVAPKNMGGMH